MIGARRRKTVETQSLCLEGQTYSYQLTRSERRRRLSLQVDERGVHVHAPWLAGVAEIESFLQRHGDWLRTTLARLASAEIVVADGVRFPLLGHYCELALLPDSDIAQWSQLNSAGERLQLGYRCCVLSALEEALQQRALATFLPRLVLFCQLLGVAVPPLRLSQARTRWGSCSARSGIRLNWRLVHLAPQLIDYVIAHEVAHLREMNHSGRFWLLLEQLCPHWRAARQDLHEIGRQLPRFVPAATALEDSTTGER